MSPEYLRNIIIFTWYCIYVIKIPALHENYERLTKVSSCIIAETNERTRVSQALRYVPIRNRHKENVKKNNGR